MIGAPMLKDGVAGRRDRGRLARAGATPPRQVELLKTFADQAVIAIENVRLINETKEALEQQTATAEILRVISSSPTDVQPVFDAIARARDGCCAAASMAASTRFDGELLHLVSYRGTSATRRSGDACRVPDAARAAARPTVARSSTGATGARSPTSARTPSTGSRMRADRSRRGSRSLVGAAAARGPRRSARSACRARGARARSRRRQIALLETFADQAVIAIENVRLFNETKEALEQQTATAEILRVISQLADRRAAGVRRDRGSRIAPVRRRLRRTW